MKLMWGPLRLLRSKIPYWWLITLPREGKAAPVVEVAKVLTVFFLGVKVWKDKASKPGTNKQCHPSLVIVVPSIDRRPLTTLWCLFGPSTTSTSSTLTISTRPSTTGTTTTTHWQPFGVWRTKRLSLPDNRHLSPATNLCSTTSELNNRILNIYL